MIVNRKAELMHRFPAMALNEALALRAWFVVRPLLATLLLLFTVVAGKGLAQVTDRAIIEGEVKAGDSGVALAYTNVEVLGTHRGAVVGMDGRFRIANLAPGTYKVRARFLGYAPQTRRVALQAGQTVQVTFTLQVQPLEMQGIVVTALRPDLQPETEMTQQEVREANPRDVAEILREVAGLDAVRRGPVGLDPVVQGLRETQLGVYLDGTRIFPGGPGRMDSPLSHFDPSSLRNIEVVKGPYALTWGAGNMSAIRATTQSLPPHQSGLLHGNLGGGYDSNLNAIESTASLGGTLGAISYWLSGAWREGDDYKAGNGQLIPADFRSREIRGKVGYALNPASHLNFFWGYQDQNNIDYPGRLLDAGFFHTYHLKGEWRYRPAVGLLRSVTVMAYVNNVDHSMNNSQKPTAQPNPNRIPPFALDVVVQTGARVAGGRAAVELVPRALLQLEAGADLYSVNRDAQRTIRHRDSGRLMFSDIVWPDASITDFGLFVQAKHPLGLLSALGTVRLDLVQVKAGSTSIFFQQNTRGALEPTEANISAALSLATTVGDHWSISGGIGSVVRTADATERYSDRFPSSKAQTSAEFMGNPRLNPERSTQFDLWINSRYPRWTLNVSGFYRYLNDYITLAATALPKRLPLSPNTVFRYINGNAVFVGFDGTLGLTLIDPLTLRISSAFIWALDRTLHEPVLGIPPFKIDVGLRYREPRARRFFVEGVLHWTRQQRRVATNRGEIPTASYTTVDLKGGITLIEGVELRGGIINLTDTNYVNHLNAKNPFTQAPVPEPGRVVFAELGYSF